MNKLNNNRVDDTNFDLVNDEPINHQEYIENIAERPAKRKAKRKK